MTNAELLGKFGFGYVDATLVMTAFISQAPENSNQDADITKRLVAAIQNFLNDRYSARLPQTGVIDADTAAALNRFHGPGWQLLYWSQVYDKLYYVAEAWQKLPGEYKPAPILTGTPVTATVATTLPPPPPVEGFKMPWWGWVVGGGLVLSALRTKKRGRR